MGFLAEGQTLDWDETQKWADYVREHGVEQFLSLYCRNKHRVGDVALWGDEVEYIVVHVNPEERTVRLLLSASEYLPILQKPEHQDPKTAKTLWRPEYGSFMLEATPGQPYQKQLSELLLVEPNMALRRATLEAMLKPGERLLMITAFPRMGVDTFTHPPLPAGGHKANSLYVPDAVINPHPRFGTLTRNIRKRRGSNVSILVPLFMDAHTQLQPQLPSPERYLELAMRNSTPVQSRRRRADSAPLDSMHRVRSASVSVPGTSQEHADASCDPSVSKATSTSACSSSSSSSSSSSCASASSSSASSSRCSSKNITASSIIACVSKCGGGGDGGVTSSASRSSASTPSEGCSVSSSVSSSSSSSSVCSSSVDSSSTECCTPSSSRFTATTPGTSGSPRPPLSAEEIRSRQAAGLWLPPSLDGKVIHMDAMAFGMGACCLQCTYQCCSIDEAASHYDALAVLSPLFLALTAACPVVRGMVADTDVRWHVIAASVDDRSPVERGLEPLDPKGSHAADTRHRRRLPKSRYDSIDCYISPNSRALNTCEQTYNDIEVVVDEDIYQYLLKKGISRRLARHVAHLFVRDPLVMYSDQLKLDDQLFSAHFENIQSTNWNSVRFKPPPVGDEIGWRVEFRTCELSATDRENAYFSCFITLMLRVISHFEIELRIPISRVEENMQTAHARNAVQDHRFWFRCNLLFREEDEGSDKPCWQLKTMDEIFNGDNGLCSLVETYLETLVDVDAKTLEYVNRVVAFVSQKASGKLCTTASWIRSFVREHPDYKQDSVVTDAIQYDLLDAIDQITHGKLHIPALHGDLINCEAVA